MHQGRRALALPTLAAAVLLAACGSSSVVPQARRVALATPAPTATATAAPTPTPTAVPPAPAPARYVASTGVRRPAPPPAYPLIGHFDAGRVGVHIPVVSVGLDHGAMAAPEGPLGSMFWREGFWLRLGVLPGNPGTATIAGHLDDTAGRPAAFWNIRNLVVGDEVVVTRSSDGAVKRFRIVETDVWTLAQANTAANLQRIYGNGTAGDGVARLSLITCTGHWNGHEYDHRFVAFAVLES